MSISRQCPLSRRIAQGIHCQKRGNFSEIRHFLTHHSPWPAQEGMRKKAEEELMNFPQSPQEIVSWFKKFPPLTGKGALVYIQALRKNKEKPLSQIAGNLLLSSSFSQEELTKFLGENHSLLTKNILFMKANTLLDQGEKESKVKIFIPYLSQNQQQVILLRLKPSLGDSVRGDSGVILDHIRLRRQNDQTEAAIKLLREMKEIPAHQADYFWREQNILARRLIEQKRYGEAYQVVDKHQLKEGENFANAEWLAGWLSLRFLKKAPQALGHFRKLREKVRSPISVARAEYWQGQTYQKLGKKEASKTAFKAAATHMATYYGQLAYKELYGKIPLISLKESVISSTIRQKFEARPLVQIIRILLALKEMGHAEAFAICLAKHLDSSAERELLVILMEKKGNPYLSVQMAKKTAVTSASLIPAAYPKLNKENRYCSSDCAMTLAIIRQESRFKPDAVSPAGAVGLMQLMPATALHTLQKHKLKKGLLTDPTVNVTIGTRHLKDLLTYFDGSLILAAAAYNAGVSAVNNWVVTFGDPRQSRVDLTDWVELIPYMETRNYVQRVLENYHCYLKLG